MYYSEYLRNKKRAAPQIISPPTGRDSSLWIQMQRYKNSVAIPTATQSAGQMLLLSSAGVLGAKGNAAVCCATTITQPTRIEGTCCDLIAPEQFPRGFYGPVKPDCCPINGPPIGGENPCCPDLPANTSQVIFIKKPTTQG